MGKHVHVWTVLRITPADEPAKDKAGRDYWYRVSVCEGGDGCEQHFTEGAYRPWPASPAVGERLG